jgi:hypothetical protein
MFELFDEEALMEMLTELESGTGTTKLIYDEYEDELVPIPEQALLNPEFNIIEMED